MNQIKTTHRGDENLFRNKLVYQLVFVFILALLLLASSAHAELKSLNEEELKSSTAQAGFTNFTMSESTARLFLDIHIETHATIDSLSSGWYNNGSGVGWDIQWNDITLGKTVDELGNPVDEPLTIDGLVFIADFDDTSAANPVLERIVIGSNRLQGTLVADMASFSGMYNDALIGGAGTPVSLSRGNVSPSPITFNFNSDASQTSDMGLFFVLTMEGSKAGLQVVAGYDEATVKTLSPSPNEWWDSP